MSKYRIVKKGPYYYPEVRFLWFFWHSTTEPTPWYSTLEEACTDVEEHRRLFGEDSKDKVVWWD